MVTQSEMVNDIHAVLRAEGVKISKAEIRRAFPGRFNTKLFGVWLHTYTGHADNAIKAINRRLVNDQSRPKKGARKALDRWLEQLGDCLSAASPEIGPDDCPYCGCKEARLSSKCPSCDEMW